MSRDAEKVQSPRVPALHIHRTPTHRAQNKSLFLKMTRVTAAHPTSDSHYVPLLPFLSLWW